MRQPMGTGNNTEGRQASFGYSSSARDPAQMKIHLGSSVWPSTLARLLSATILCAFWIPASDPIPRISALGNTVLSEIPSGPIGAARWCRYLFTSSSAHFFMSAILCIYAKFRQHASDVGLLAFELFQLADLLLVCSLTVFTWALGYVVVTAVTVFVMALLLLVTIRASLLTV
ncbi:uncharacterized protein PHACADRAFT_259061 [Phanerochaete carnosa HHB-10118-sp]|uniref:Uncharacterized protein n=1 Tax=Phanerochaete carnosa (strain HHB-10118-sp) TaxID=650164 RepID=K5W6X7_PHACS|nr:uncharacterized protein PHACADRAFT_259061 [Phanerochaete carnosa HHB-10118-sp]EKM54895.1 hypothetical protein PHACADRAFT_259061 [Phanerochaete carnosa HHB-10118-sp]